ncbi:MAG: hypothetical protein A2058_14630 [Ignavibacteria bacterium GWA2_36_19]|nr:MAG: hypothetical protein A2058_14630 [Ignavibacteria bacterium GWA2_36_19]
MKYLSGIFGSLTSKVLMIFLLIFVFADVSKPQQNSNNTADGQISGIFIDFHTREPLEFVNFILTSLKDSNIIIGTSSGKDGRFLLKGIAYDRYKAKVSLIGYKTRTRREMIISSNQKTIQLDTIFLMPKEILTEEVKIVSDKYPMVYDKENKDKLIISPDRSWGTNAYELLETAPMIDVDIESGAIGILGKGNTVIYINGMPAEYSGMGSPENLKLLAFSEIEKIELVMDPLKEYGEVKDGGVINIVTKREVQDHFNGSLSFSSNTNHTLGGNGYVGVTFGKLSFNGSYGNTYSRDNTSTSMSKTFEYDSNANYFDQLENNTNQSSNNTFSFGASYNLDSAGIISINSYYNPVYSNNDRMLDNTTMDQNHSSLDHYLSNSNSRTLQTFFSNSISYFKSFKERGHRFSGSLSYSKNQMVLTNDANRKQVFSDSLSDNLLSQKNSSINNNNSLRWSFFYNRPITETIDIMGAYTGSSRKLVMNSSYTDYDTLKHAYIEDLTKKVDQNYSETVQELSFTCAGELFDIQYDFGFAIKNNITNDGNNSAGFSGKTQSNSLTRYLSVNTNISENGRINLTYVQGMSSPMNKFLNPYSDYTDSTNIVVGNPNLKPVIQNQYNASYSYTDGYLRTGISANYSLTTDGIEQVSQIISPKVMQTTYENLSSQKSFNTNIYFSDRFFKWLDVQPNFSVEQNEFKGSRVNNKGREWSSSLRTKLLFEDYKFLFDFRYSSPTVGAQETQKAKFSANAVVRTLLFDKNVSLVLQVNDVFNTRNNNYDRTGSNFLVTNNVRKTTRMVTLSISYFFQRLTNDDVDEIRTPDAVPDDF